MRGISDVDRSSDRRPSKMMIASSGIGTRLVVDFWRRVSLQSTINASISMPVNLCYSEEILVSTRRRWSSNVTKNFNDNVNISHAKHHTKTLKKNKLFTKTTQKRYHALVASMESLQSIESKIARTLFVNICCQQCLVTARQETNYNSPKPEHNALKYTASFLRRRQRGWRLPFLSSLSLTARISVSDASG